MAGVKTVAAMLARFLLGFALIACLWIVSISYRIGAFDFQGADFAFHMSGGFAASDGLFLAALLALLIGLLGLYRSGRISAVLIVLVSLIALAAIDHFWSAYGYFDDYKAVPRYVMQPAILAALICPLAFLFPARPAANDKVLALCWAALILLIFLIGSHMLGLTSMIGPTYMKDVFLCLIAVEALRQARRWYRAYSFEPDAEAEG